MDNDNLFWGGSSVHGGRVRRLNARSFRECVERYIFIPVAFSMTRKEFFALPTDEQNSRKDGPYITACAFDFGGADEGHRHDDAATLIHSVIIDLDEGGTDFNESPDTIGEHLYPYSFVCWQTAKHTKAAPRLKIMVEVDPCHPSDHRKLVRYVAQKLGLPKDFAGARESRVISQPQYRPIQFKGSEFTAVIASRLDGKALSVSDIPVIDDEEELGLDRTFAADRNDDDDILHLAYLPVADLTLSQVRDALFAIDPDCSYKMWYEVFAALRHQFTDEDDARQAYDMAVEWSSGGSKFKGEADCYSKWKSFQPYAKGRAPVTVRTLFKHAMEAGWDNGRVAAQIQLTVSEWFKQCTSGDELMHEGARRIAAMPFRNDVVEEALVIAWRERIREVTNNTIDKVILRREIARQRKLEVDAKHEKRKENLPSWLQPQCYVACEDVFYNFATGVTLKPAAFDRNFEKELISKDDPPANGKAILQPSAYALNLMEIPRVDGTIYCPLHQGEDPFFEINGRRLLNTFDRIHVPVEDPDYAEQAGEMIYAHIATLVAEPEIREVLLDYLAILVQFPGRKIPWLPCIQSAEGTGKGFLGKIMAAVLGQGNVKIVSPEIIRSEWNDWMIGAQFTILEEIHFPGERREAVMNTLKPFITDPVIPINQRNTSARNEFNWTNAIAFTNFPDALHLKEWDRRWMFVRSPLQTSTQVAAVNESGHFERMEWLLTDAGAGGLRYWFRKREIAESFPMNGPAPKTTYRSAIVEGSKNIMQITIEDIIEDDEHPLVSKKVIHLARLTELVYRGAPNKDSNRIANYLTAMGYERWGGGQRILLDGARGPVWVLKSEWRDEDDPVAYLRKRMDIMEEEFEI